MFFSFFAGSLSVGFVHTLLLSSASLTFLSPAGLPCAEAADGSSQADLEDFRVPSVTTGLVCSLGWVT